MIIVCYEAQRSRFAALCARRSCEAQASVNNALLGLNFISWSILYRPPVSYSFPRTSTSPRNGL
jgi:hypothetical protein